MNRSLYVSTVILAGFLLIGSLFYTTDPLMWLASTTTGFNLARLSVTIVGLLLTFKMFPDWRPLRIVLGALGAGLAIWAFVGGMDNQLKIFDTLVFMNAGVVFGLAALEVEPIADIDLASAQAMHARSTFEKALILADTSKPKRSPRVKPAHA